MTDHAVVLLLHAGQVTGAVDEGDDRERVHIADANEPADLVRGIDVQHARHHHRLVGHDAYRSAVQAGESDQRIGGKSLVDFQNRVGVKDFIEHLADIISFTVVLGNDGIQHLAHPVGRVVGEQDRGIV